MPNIFRLFFCVVILLAPYCHFGVCSEAQPARHVLNVPLLFAASSDKKGELAKIRLKIEETNRQMVEAFKRGNLLDVAAFYEDEATIYYPRGMKVHGRKAIDSYWNNVKGGKDWKLEVIEVGGDNKTVYEIGKSTFVSEINGKESTFVSDFVLIWKFQKNGKYKIHVEIFN
jgi:ketosteroid isomerase-like protein